MNRQEIKAEARGMIKGKWLGLFGRLFLYTLVIGIVTSIISNILGIISPLQTTTTGELFGVETVVATSTPYGTLVDVITSIMSVVFGLGSAYMVLNFVKTNELPSIGKMFTDALDVVKKRWVTVTVASVLYFLAVFAGTLLFVIPGIIVALGFSMYLYLSLDEPELSGVELLKKSWEMTKGYKLSLLAFGLSFILWFFACMFVIPVIYVLPYIEVASVLYYVKLKATTAA